MPAVFFYPIVSLLVKLRALLLFMMIGNGEAGWSRILFELEYYLSSLTLVMILM